MEAYALTSAIVFLRNPNRVFSIVHYLQVQIKKAALKDSPGGGRGIRTPGPLRHNGFQDRHVRPLRHSSVTKIKNLIFYIKL